MMHSLCFPLLAASALHVIIQAGNSHPCYLQEPHLHLFCLRLTQALHHMRGMTALVLTGGKQQHHHACSMHASG